MKIILLIATCIGLAASAQPAGAEGALAIKPNSDRYGFSHSYANRNDASQRALQECGSGCQVVLNFDGKCAAYAVDTRPGSDFYGWGMQATADSARTRALQECQSRAGYGAGRPGRRGGCTVRVSACD